MRPTTSAVLHIFLQKASKKWRFSQILEAVRLFLDEAALQVELQALEQGGWIEKDAKGRYALRLLGHTFPAEVQSWRDQAYVVLPPFGLRVLLGDMHKLRLLLGDKVEVEIVAIYPEEVIGRIVRRLQPSQRTFVGIVEEGRNRRLYVRPQQPLLEIDFQLPRNTPSSLVGKKVAIRFLEWGLKYPIAEVVQVLGDPRNHHTEIHAILYEFELPEGFPDEVLAEAASLPDDIPPEEIERRHDFRGIPTFTIDPTDAKDFDDALSLRYLPNGLVEVGIHIADVSYYVKEDSALDREAAQRGTSVYLVDRTIPMLPERLSAHLCSLKPNEDRLAFSIVFQMDERGQIHGSWMGRSIIRSQHRFTYEEAQTVLETSKGPFAEELKQIHHLARLLHENRMKEGGIRFETEEIRFDLDENFQPIRIHVKERKDSHRLIEEFMLLANRHVARFLSQQRLPTVYRVHDVPKPDKLKALKLFLEGWGYTIDIHHPRALTHSLNLLSEAIQGKPESHIIQAVAIRSMPKALYTPHNIGHYGLGFTHYTHFTSPIRRYPDLLVHRILGAVLANQPSPYGDLGRLEALCRHSSEREKIAEQAERASIRYKQLEYLSRMTGKKLEGIIVGIESWGLYVELIESRAEGLVSLQSLPTDIYERDEYGHEMRARYTRRRYRLGDKVVVKVVGIDFDRRLVDLELLQHEGERIR